MIETHQQAQPYFRQMLQEMGREPTPEEELAERMLMPEDKDPQSAEDRQRANLHGNADR